MQTAGRIIDCCLKGQRKLTIQTQLLYYHLLFFNSTQEVKKKKTFPILIFILFVSFVNAGQHSIWKVIMQG